jgi:plastocyanin
MRLILVVIVAGLLVACATPAPTSPEPAPPPAEPPPEPTVVRTEPVVDEPLVTREPEPEPTFAPEPPPPAGDRLPVETDPDPYIASDAIAAEPEPEARIEPSEAAIETATLSGRIRIFQNGREQPFASLHLNQTVIAWQPMEAASAAALPEQQIVTRRSRFFPQTVAVTSGTPVRFPNMDTIQHNVFSLTPGHRFDSGLYGEGEGEVHQFIGSGMVELFCNVHPNMAAFVLVLETDHFTTPDQNGEFVLTDLPKGPGELLIWNYRANTQLERRNLRLGSYQDPLNLDINITRPSVPQHTNKHGESYSRGRARP